MKRSGGVSLIEVLVALLVLSLGVISIVALQLFSKRNNSDAIKHTLAAQYANELLDRMRNNNHTMALQEYLDQSATGIGGGVRTSEPSPNCITAACTPVEVAAHDAWELERALDGGSERIGTNETGGVTSPTACVTASVPGGESALYTVSIAFRGGNSVPSNTADTCGQGAVDGAGDPLYGDNDEYRRVVAIEGYINPQ